MPKLTKRQFEEMFREEVLPHLVASYEQDGVPDKPARREAWNDTVDAYIRDRALPEAAGNWAHPRWLETYRPSPSRHHSTVKTSAKFSNKQIGGYLQAAREPMGISFNDNYNKPTYGITKADYDEINRAMHAAYGMFPERTLAGVRKALKGAEGRHHSTVKKTKAQLDREIAEVLARHDEDLKIGDAVQFRSEPGTGGVIRRISSIADADGRNWALVATPHGARKVPVDGLRRVRKEHESRVRAAARDNTPSHATKRVAKTKVLYVVQGNYGYGHGWEDVTAAETWKEAKQYLRDYRENERGVPFRSIRRRERITA